MSSSPPLNIVFIALSLHGQLNVYLATIECLLSLDGPDVSPLHIHLMTFDEAAKHAKKLSSLANGSRHTFTFDDLGEHHLFDELSQTGTIDRHGPAVLFRRGGLKPYMYLADLMGFNPDRYIEIYRHILSIFHTIQPRIDLAVIDPIMSMGKDACRTAGVKWGILCPNSSFEFARFEQPALKGLWHYPAPYSAIPYPVPLHLTPYNIALNALFIRTILGNPRVKALNARRAQEGLTESMVEPLPKELPFMICASVKEMEFPHVVPHTFVLAGPILSPVPPVSDKTYPEMATFLSRKRTFVINMGSNFWYTVDDVANVANAIVIARERCGENCPFQVLWKLNGMKAFDTLLSAILEGMMDDVRMEEWIIPPMLAILQHANVAGFVNHGGANSVHEGAYAGVPQIILPQWIDLYDYAVRVEWLGHGIYGNKGFDARIDAVQLADAFVRILSPDEGTAMKSKALEVMGACRKGGGVNTVARTILKAAIA